MAAKKLTNDLVVTQGDMTIVNPIDMVECNKLIGLSKAQISILCRRGKIKNIRKGKWIMICPKSALAYEAAPVGMPGHQSMVQRRLAWEKSQEAKGLPLDP